jgi:hypothetical protein
MKNAILKICEKLRGYSADTEPYFEVKEIHRNDDGTFTLNVEVVDPAAGEQGAQNESNK